MEDSKIKSRYLKLFHEFRDLIRCKETVVYRPHCQKFCMCPLIKRLGRAFVLKHVTGPLKHSAEPFKHSAKL